MSEITTNIEKFLVNANNELIDVKVVNDSISVVDVSNVIVRETEAIELYTAGENINAHRIVYLKNEKLFHASNDDLNSFNTVIGMSLNAANLGDVVRIKRFGVIEQTSWGLQENSFYYLGLNGLITKDANKNGEFIQSIGFAQTNEKLNLDIKLPIGL